MSSKSRHDLLQVEVELTEEQLQVLLSDRPWSPLPEDLEAIVHQLPATEERCLRTAILAWAHRLEGLIGFPQVWGAITGYADNRSTRKAATRTLDIMVRQNLLTRLHFNADAPDANPNGTNEGTAFEMTGAGLLYLRGACLARQKLARGYTLTEAHRIISGEEDDGHSHELHYLPGVIVRDASGKRSVRHQRVINSVFGLAAAR